MFAPVTIDQQSINVWIARLNLLPPQVEALYALLSQDERLRAERLQIASVQHRFVVARGLLRSLLGTCLAIEPSALRFGFGEHGKPFLARPHGELQFNLAHSSNLAIFAVTRGRAVGVDLEQLRDLPNAAALVARFFAPEEQVAWHNLPLQQQREGFFRIWTRKEAYLKASGRGIAGGLRHFAVSLEPGSSGLLRNDDDTQVWAGWRLVELAPAPGYLAALAAPGTWQVVLQPGLEKLPSG